MTKTLQTILQENQSAPIQVQRMKSIRLSFKIFLRTAIEISKANPLRSKNKIRN